MANKLPKIDESIFSQDDDNKPDGRSPRPTTSAVERNRQPNVSIPKFEPMTPSQPSQDVSGGVSSTARTLADSIQQVESGGRQVAGASGEFGSFQFMPATWEAVSQEVEGAVLPQTPENERRVAEKKIDQLLQRGHSPREVALIWNTSLAGAEEPREIKGTNDQGVAYDSGAYADKVEQELSKRSQGRGEGISRMDVAKQFPGAFARELGNFGQGIARGFGDLGGPIAETIVPGFESEDAVKGRFGQALYGEETEDLSATLGGQEIASIFGGVERGDEVEGMEKFLYPALSVAVGSLDAVPGGRRVMQESAERIARSTDIDDIISNVRRVVDGDEDDVNILAQGLRNINDPNDARRILEEAGKDSNDWIAALANANEGNAFIRPSANKTTLDKTLGTITKTSDVDTIRSGLDDITVGSGQYLDNLAQRIARQADEDSLSAFDIRQNILDDIIPENASQEILERTGRFRAGKSTRAAGDELTTLERTFSGSPRKAKQAAEQSFKRGGREASQKIQDFQQQLTDLANEGDSSITQLSNFAYGNTVNTAIRNATDERSFKAAQDFISDTKEAMRQSTEISKARGRLRSNIAYLRKLGEFDQGAMNDVKAAIDVDKPIKDMNLDELNRMQDEVGGRVRYKDQRNLGVNRRLQDQSPEELTQSDFDKVKEIGTNRKTLWDNTKDVFKGFRDSSGKLFSPLTTRLENVYPKLKHLLRNEYDVQVARLNEKDLNTIDELQTTVRNNLDDDQIVELDYALKNREMWKIDELVEEHPEVGEAIERFRELDNRLFSEAKSVNMDIEFMEDHFPRWIKNVDGFMDDILGGEARMVERAFEGFERKMGRKPSDVEREDILNKMIRGYNQFGVTLSDPTGTNRRIIDKLTPEMNQYYANSFDAMRNYVMQMNDSIQMKRLLGKEIQDATKFDLTSDGIDIGGTIGAYIDDALRSGEISTKEQLDEVRNVLEARFNPGHAPAWASSARSATYLGLLSNPRSVLTQAEDLAVSLYENGMYDTFTGLKRAITGDTMASFREQGLAMGSVQLDEASSFKKFTDRMMSWSGFQKMENIMNEGMMEATLINAQRNARRAGRQNQYSVQKYADEFYGVGTEAREEFITKVENGVVDDDVLNFAVSKILDYKPLALSDMPEAYVRGNESKVAYTLQSFTLKRIDTVRREIFQEIRDNPKQGFSNLIRFTGYVMAMGISVDTAQDLLLDKEMPETERIITENLMKVAGPSAYLLDQIDRDGFAAAMGQTAAATLAIPEAIINDFSDAIGGDIDSVAGMETVGLLPLIGVMLNARFGSEGSGISPSGGGSSDSGIPRLGPQGSGTSSGIPRLGPEPSGGSSIPRI